MADQNNFKRIFGKKEINSKSDLDVAMAEANKIIVDANQKMATDNANIQNAKPHDLNEFEKSLVVDNVAPLDLPRTQYEKLNPEQEKNLKLVLQNLTREDLDRFEEVKNAEGKSSNGEPFKCFASLDGNGDLIVTPNKVIEIHKKDDENYEYSETRMGNNQIKKVNIHTVHGISNIHSAYYPKNITSKDIREIETFTNFFRQPKNAIRLEVQKMNSEEKAIYMLELQRLGINIREDKLADIDSMTEDQVEAAKESGKLLHVSSATHARKISGKLEKEMVNFLYSPEEDRPQTIWSVSQDGNGQEFTGNVYRRTANGKYIDSGSIEFVGGRVKYQMLDYEEIQTNLERKGYDIESINLQMEKNKELAGKMPREAETIQERAENQLARGNEENEYEDEVFPGANSNRM